MLSKSIPQTDISLLGTVHRESLSVFLSFLVSVAIYKALYKRFGGFAADIIAAIDQVEKRNFKTL